MHGRFRSLLSPSRRRAREDFRRDTYSSGVSLCSTSAAALGSLPSAGAGAGGAAGVVAWEGVVAAAGTGVSVGAAGGSVARHAALSVSVRTLSSPLQVGSPGSDMWTANTCCQKCDISTGIYDTTASYKCNHGHKITGSRHRRNDDLTKCYD